MVSSAIYMLLLQLVETVTHRAVDHRVADRRHDAAEHRLVDHDLHLDLLAGRPRERLGDPLLLRVVERDRRAHLGHRVLAGLGRELDEAVDDRRAGRGPGRRRR